MSASHRLRSLLVAVVLAMVAMLVATTGALGAGITLDRTISPPQAVGRGTGTQTFTFNITFTSTPDHYTFRVLDPNGVPIGSPVTQNVQGQSSPIVGTQKWSPPSNAIPGRYTAEVQFFNTNSSVFELQAAATFYVADELGTLQLVKFEDINGNGVRDPGEPGVANWGFRITNPQGNSDNVSTLTDGTSSTPNVPAGTWRVDEILQGGWVAVSPPGGTVQVPANGTGTFTVGNVRPAPLSGTVWVDANRNKIIDKGEAKRGGVTLTLTGTTGTGQTVAPQTTVTAANGTYTFPDLLPGTYAVAVTVPGGFSATTPVNRTNLPIRSNQGNPNNDFGIAQGSGTVTQTPDISIDKRGPATASPGQVFTYTIVVKNLSSFAATNVQVTDLVPANLTLVAIPNGAVIRNGVVTWSLGTMKAGASRTLTMRVRVNPNTTATKLVNTATVTATGLGPKRDSVTTRIKRTTPVVRRSGGVTG